MKIIAVMSSERKARFRKLWSDFYGGFVCAYCEKIDVNHTIDHLIPRSKGGNNRLENLVIACFECNQLKADKTLNEFGSLKLLPIKLEFTNAN